MNYALMITKSIFCGLLLQLSVHACAESTAQNTEAKTSTSNTTLNLLKNPGFEKLTPAGQPDSWRGMVSAGKEQKTFSLDSQGNSGSNSLKIQHSNGDSFSMVIQDVSVERNRTYEFSAYAKSADIISTGYGPQIVINGNNRLLGRVIISSLDWQKVSLKFNSGDCDKIRIYCNLHLAAGTVWFDDLVLTPVSGETNKNTTVDVSEGEIIKNGDFRKLNADGKPLHWQFAPQAKVVKDKDGASLHCNGAEKQVRVASYTGIRLENEQLYDLKYQVKCAPGQSYRVRIVWRTQEGLYGRGTSHSWQNGTGEWQDMNIEFESPSEHSNFTPTLFVELSSPGTAYFRNFSMIPVDNRPAITLIPGDWQPLSAEANCKYIMNSEAVGSDGHSLKIVTLGNSGSTGIPAGCKLRITSRDMLSLNTMYATIDAYVKSKEDNLPFQITLEGEYDKAEKTETIELFSSDNRTAGKQGENYSFDFRIPDNIPSRFILKLISPDKGELDVSDLKIVSKRQQESDDDTPKNWYLDRRETMYGNTAGRIRIREEDQCLLVNGTPTFPIWVLIGRWNATGSMLADSVNHGATGIVSKSSHYYISMFRKLNLNYINWNNFGDRGVPEDQIHARVKGMMQFARQHPNFLGWFLDEPAIRTVPRRQVEEHFRILSEHNDEYLFWVNFAPRGNKKSLSRYAANTCDLSGCDIYPLWGVGGHSGLPNKTLSSVGEYTSRMRDIVDNSKPIIMMLQAGGWDRDFTYEAARFMYFDAIINGTNGVVCYTESSMKNLETTWPALMKVISEIRALEPALTSVRKSEAKLLGNIQVLGLNDGTSDYWLCANREQAATEIPLSQIVGIQNVKNVKVLFENRENPDSIEKFKPYQVHIYTTSVEKITPWKADSKLTDSKLKTRDYKEVSRELLAEGIFGYGWKSKWIWNKQAKELPENRIFIRKVFTVSNKPQEAFLLAGFDLSGSVFVNGKLLTKNQGFNNFNAESHDITSALKIGNNCIAIDAKGPSKAGFKYSGVLAEIIIKTDKTTVFPSDSSWKTNLREYENWTDVDYDDSDWSPADEAGTPPIAPWRYIGIIPNDRFK